MGNFFIFGIGVAAKTRSASLAPWRRSTNNALPRNSIAAFRRNRSRAASKGSKESSRRIIGALRK